MSASRIYLDNAATTTLDKTVLDAMMPYLTEKFGNPSSIYSYGRETRMAVENARKSVAAILNARPAEIFFTSGGTESSNTAITAAVRDLGCTRIITSALEHHAVGHTVDYLRKFNNIRVELVGILPDGHINLAHLEELLAAGNDRTLVTLMHANNEIGTLLDMQAVGSLCKQYHAFFHSDTVQTVGHFPFDLRNTPVDFITGSAHKFHGPKGAGILYINENIRISPLLYGGGQERNMRAGTENLYGIVGFAKALEMATANYETDSAYIGSLKAYMHDEMQKKIPGISFNGYTPGRSLYTVLSANFPKTERSEMILYNLDINNICVSGGSACTSGANQGSHVIKALYPGSSLVTVRFSFSKYNTKEEVDYTIAKLEELL
ncbi:MAG: cysteine desulfurase family protein [Ferruginibacter sp.]